ncbi:hypothetical protein N9L26_00525 [Candidatus Pacebacteria bacterium]|nr:hypothetical protein [Candidatus Paceibacterota bacterium]
MPTKKAPKKAPAKTTTRAAKKDSLIVPDEELKMPAQTFTPREVSDKPSRMGVILGVLIVLLILILAGLYLWGTTLKNDNAVVTPITERPSAEENNEPESTTAEAQTETFTAVSTSDELSAIEADIESTNLDSLDAELTAIEAELEASAE